MCVDKAREIPKKPRWFNIHYGPGEPACGRILVSFSCVSHDYEFQRQIEYVNLKDRVNF